MAESDRSLVLLDVTTDFITGPDAAPNAVGIVRYVAGELRYFRERGRPIIFACTQTSPGQTALAAELLSPPKIGDINRSPPKVGEILTELTPRSDERVLFKPAPSAFFRTDLHEILLQHGVRRLTLVGTETHTSILLTAADAVARGFEVVVPEPCVCARSQDDHRFALRQIREVWPSWPRAAGLAMVDLDETGRLRRHAE